MRAIETKTARSKLQVSKNPVFARLGQGTSIGYRRNVGGAGVWIVRIADGKRGKTEKRLALADDLGVADGRTIMNFQQAAEAARRLGRGDAAEEARPIIDSLADAIEAYRADLQARAARADNVTRLKSHLSPAMLKRPVGLIDVAELRRWRDGLAKKIAPASVNRTITIMKAVLNLAASKDERLSARPWEVGLTSLPEATSARNVVLSSGTIRQIVEAAREQSPEFGLLAEALAVTGARVSQLARCAVVDLVDDRLMIPSSAKGRAKRATRVPVPIGTSLANRLRVAAAGRVTSGPLFTKPSGEAWAKSDHCRLFGRAAVASGENPATVTCYSLRHSHITAQLLAGLPVQAVAKLHDTSAVQIEKHYAAAIANHVDELVRTTMTNFDGLAETAHELEG